MPLAVSRLPKRARRSASGARRTAEGASLALFPGQKEGMQMRHFLMKVLMFRIGQKAAKGFARSIGLKRASGLIGLIAGYKHMRRHA